MLEPRVLKVIPVMGHPSRFYAGVAGGRSGDENGHLPPAVDTNKRCQRHHDFQFSAPSQPIPGHETQRPAEIRGLSRASNGAGITISEMFGECGTVTGPVRPQVITAAAVHDYGIK